MKWQGNLVYSVRDSVVQVLNIFIYIVGGIVVS